MSLIQSKDISLRLSRTEVLTFDLVIFYYYFFLMLTEDIAISWFGSFLSMLELIGKILKDFLWDKTYI